ncbi:MAG: hypothetical protein QME96_07960 [Myxococcota bacterium]|nr:hypothetical protein [Myxococcota bacterium]
MSAPEPRVLGFFKEADGPEEMTAPLKADGEALYVEVTSGFRNRVELVVGNVVKAVVEDVARGGSGPARPIGGEAACEVVGYWNELHLPPGLTLAHGLRPGDVVRLTLRSIVQHGVERPV